MNKSIYDKTIGDLYNLMEHGCLSQDIKQTEDCEKIGYLDKYGYPIKFIDGKYWYYEICWSDPMYGVQFYGKDLTGIPEFDKDKINEVVFIFHHRNDIDYFEKELPEDLSKWLIKNLFK